MPKEVGQFPRGGTAGEELHHGLAAGGEAAARALGLS